MSHEEDVKVILESLNLEYTRDGDLYLFSQNDIPFWLDGEGRIGVSKKFFGEIPHVLSNGYLCISGNTDIRMSDGDDVIKETINTYTPWLFSLSANFRVAEMLAELDYYIESLLGYSCSVLKRTSKFPTDTKLIYIMNPSDLWEEIEKMELGSWYKFIPANLENHFIYLMRVKNNKFAIYYDAFSKSRMRVSGNNYNKFSESKNIAFIGVGSVNSYILKKLASEGANKFILVDDDIVKVDNLFRFAFPYPSKKKIDAASFFINKAYPSSHVTKKYFKINKDTKNILADTDIIFVSVDNFKSWLEVIPYVAKNSNIETSIYLTGIDIFGSYGKFLHVKKSLKNDSEFINKMVEFLTFIPSEKAERKQMIGNGCGKSIAIYDEFSLLKLASAVCKNQTEGEIIYVPFQD